MRAPILHSSHWSRIFHDMHPHRHHRHCRPLLSSLSLISLSLHSFLLPYALPLEHCFIPHQFPFIPLQPFGLLSFYPSISQILRLYFHSSTLPSFTYASPPPRTMEQASEHRTCDRRGGSLPGLPLRCHHTLICLLRFHIDFVLNKWKIQEEWGAKGDMK